MEYLWCIYGCDPGRSNPDYAPYAIFNLACLIAIGFGYLAFKQKPAAPQPA